MSPQIAAAVAGFEATRAGHTTGDAQTSRARAGQRLTEKTFMQTVVDVCRIHGYEVFHTYDSRHSRAGFPDLEIIGHGRIFHRELKLDHGHTTPEQDACIDLINQNGGDAKVWRPAMWPEIITELGGKAAA